MLAGVTEQMLVSTARADDRRTAMADANAVSGM